MIGRYALLAGRIRQDAAELVQVVVERAERAVQARRGYPAEEDLFLDSAALNLHDISTGLARIFTHIASGIDQSVPTGPDRHRALLRLITVELRGLRPQVLPAEVAGDVDEFLRFRHVVRHIYAFELEPERVERLVSRLRPVFADVRAALLALATFLDTLAHEG